MILGDSAFDLTAHTREESRGPKYFAGYMVARRKSAKSVCHGAAAVQYRKTVFVFGAE